MKISELSDFDLHLFHEGTNFHAYNLLGAHVTEENGEAGVRFSVWALMHGVSALIKVNQRAL